MQFELRSYRIEDGRLDDFVGEWREVVLPLRQRLGFSVVGPWVSREDSRFVCIVGYDGDIREADKRYYSSGERRALDPDPARLIVDATKVWLETI